jgi:hypothetical protein
MCIAPERPLNVYPDGVVQVRTQTLVKSAIVQVDATPFKQYYQQHYGVEVGVKKRASAAAEEDKKEEEVKKSQHLERKLKARNQNRKIDEVRAACPNLGEPCFLF